jgi:Glycosyl hydrolases family 43/F5/8 type C domain
MRFQESWRSFTKRSIRSFHRSLSLASPILCLIVCVPPPGQGQVNQSSQTSSQRALIPDMIADPTITEIDGTFYCYATTDGYSLTPTGYGPGVVWTSPDFLSWSFHGLIMPEDQKDKYVAPSTPVREGEKLHLFPTINHQVTPVMMKTLQGPLLDLTGQSLDGNNTLPAMPITVAKSIDAEVFTDDDGERYMVWAQRGIGHLAKDLVSFDGPQKVVATKRQGYSEGPFLFKRSGIYYYLYTLGAYENYEYAYMMSRVSPLGPWTAPDDDVLMKTNHATNIYGPGHGSVFRDSKTDKWYFAYLEYGRGGASRQVFVEQIDFRGDGTIQPLTLTGTGVGALRPPLVAGKDLSIGAHATASSFRPPVSIPRKYDPMFARNESFLPENAVDGSNGSRWMADEQDPTPWLQIDLGVVHTIKRAEAYFVTPTAGHSYRIESSTDNTHWTIYQPAQPLTIESPHTTQASVSARYLRVYVMKGTPGLWEFHVWE